MIRPTSPRVGSSRRKGALLQTPGALAETAVRGGEESRVNTNAKLLIEALIMTASVHETIVAGALDDIGKRLAAVRARMRFHDDELVSILGDPPGDRSSCP